MLIQPCNINHRLILGMTLLAAGMAEHAMLLVAVLLLQANNSMTVGLQHRHILPFCGSSTCFARTVLLCTSCLYASIGSQPVCIKQKQQQPSRSSSEQHHPTQSRTAI